MKPPEVSSGPLPSFPILTVLCSSCLQGPPGSRLCACPSLPYTEGLAPRITEAWVPRGHLIHFVFLYRKGLLHFWPQGQGRGWTLNPHSSREPETFPLELIAALFWRFLFKAAQRPHCYLCLLFYQLPLALHSQSALSTPHFQTRDVSMYTRLSFYSLCS